MQQIAHCIPQSVAHQAFHRQCAPEAFHLVDVLKCLLLMVLLCLLKTIESLVECSAPFPLTPHPYLDLVTSPGNTTQELN